MSEQPIQVDEPETGEIPPAPELLPPPPKKYNPKNLAWWHEALADWMLNNPDKPMKDAAVAFNVTPTYIYMLKNSDTFQAYWKRRRERVEAGVEQTAEEIGGTIRDKLAALAEASLDALNSRMEDIMLAGKHSNVPIGTVLETADLALKKLGYGMPAPGTGQGGGGPNTTVNVTVSADMLAEARAKMQNLFKVKTVNEPVTTIDITPTKE